MAALAVTALVATACVRESDENTNEGTNPSPGAVAVEVLVTDAGIEMPAELPGPEIMFEVTNSGMAEHGFAIDGLDERLDSLADGELATLRVELPPGEYTAYSPVEGDREAGIEASFTVIEGSDDDGAPLNEEGVGPSEEQDPIEDDGS